MYVRFPVLAPQSPRAHFVALEFAVVGFESTLIAAVVPPADDTARVYDAGFGNRGPELQFPFAPAGRGMDQDEGCAGVSACAIVEDGRWHVEGEVGRVEVKSAIATVIVGGVWRCGAGFLEFSLYAFLFDFLDCGAPAPLF